MSDIEEDIELLKSLDTTGDEEFTQAIKNVLAERKQDKAKIKELEEKNRVLCEEYYPRIAKIKDLIENETINISGFECIAVEDLEELLEESK